MKIAYVANIKFPTEKAHGFQIARTVSELVCQGYEIKLYVAAPAAHIRQKAKAFYDLPAEVPVAYMPVRNWLKVPWIPGRFGFFIRGWQMWRRALAAMRADGYTPADTLVYTRDPAAVRFFARREYVVVFNAHGWSPRMRRYVARARAVVCNSPGTEHAVAAALPSVPTHLAQNATDPNPHVGGDKRQLRCELGLPLDRTFVVYTGHLYAWKGVDVLCAAMALLPQEYVAVCVGGNVEDVVRYRAQYADGRIRFLGHQPKGLIPSYLAAADVLVLPNIPSNKETTTFTSPIKLFEYMASGVPIVASDLSSIRGVLDDTCAYFAQAGDAGAFAANIRIAADHGAVKARVALELSAQHTWERQVCALGAYLREVFELPR